MIPLIPRVIKIATGWNAQASYQAFTVEPHTDGLQYPRQIEASNGATYDDGKSFIWLTFKALDADKYVINMTLAGVYTAKTALVTLRIPDNSRVGYADYNGRAVQPVAGQDRSWDILRYQNIRLLVKRLVAL